MRTLEWLSNTCELRLIDQRLLPGRLTFVVCRSARDVAQAIRDMAVRGAPAIGAAAAYGMALEACRLENKDLTAMKAGLEEAARVLADSRPTAVNLVWALQRMQWVLYQPVFVPEKLKNRLIAEAQRIAEEDIDTNRRMAEFGAELIQDGDTIIHHCNTGALATVDIGTALGVIHTAHKAGKRIHVLVDETRPRLQGSRLTAWELEQYRIPYHIIADGAAGYFLQTGQVQKVFFGADRVAANGDVANKIGTYMLALAAHANQVPVYAVVPTSSIDLNLANGSQIPIEERSEEEVLAIQIHGQPASPSGAKARNPAFDVTPHELITALVTEKGIVEPPFKENLAAVMKSNLE